MFGQSARKTGSWAGAESNKPSFKRKTKAGVNPLMQSSLEYEQFLQARLYPRAGSAGSAARSSSKSTNSMPPPYEDVVEANDLQAYGIGRNRGDTSKRIPKPSKRPAWSSIDNTERSDADQKLEIRSNEMELQDMCANTKGAIPSYSFDDSDHVNAAAPVLQHSWRRHVTPERSATSSQSQPLGNDGDLNHAHRSSADVALLMAAAKESIEKSKQREGIIANLLKEGSRGECERLVEQESSAVSAASFIDEEEPFRLSKARHFSLTRAWHNLRKATKYSKQRTKRQMENLMKSRQEALQRQYLKNWRATTCEAAATNQSKRRRMKYAIQRWGDALRVKRKSSSQMSTAATMHRGTQEARAISLLRSLADDRKEQNNAFARDIVANRAAEGVRRHQLLKTTFGGLRKAARVDAGQREIDEESSNRRMRIAALVSTLGTKKTTPGLSLRAKEESKEEAMASRRTKSSSHLTTSPRRQQAKSESQQLSPRGLLLPLGVPVEAESKESWALESDVDHKTSFRNGVKVMSGADAKALSRKGPRNSRVLSNTAATARQADAKGSREDTGLTERGRRTTAQSQSSVPSSIKQDDIDRRAQERRVRQAELSAVARGRVAMTREAQEKQLKLLKQNEDKVFEDQQMEHRRTLIATRTNAEDRANQESELRRKTKLALAHRTKALLTRWGFGPWQRLMIENRLKWARALNYRDDTLLQQTWIALYGYCMAVRTERARKEYRQSNMAVIHYRRRLIHEMWTRWKLNKRLVRAKARAVTGHFSRFTVNRRAFGAWRVALERQRRLEVQQIRSVLPRGQRAVKRHFWGQWLAFHRDALLEREISNRANLTWQKVQGWLE